MPKFKNPEGTGVRMLRKAIGPRMTQHALAILVGVSLDTIKSIESGRVGLSNEMMRRIADATGVRPDCLREPATIWDVTETLEEDPATGIKYPMDSHTNPRQAILGIGGSIYTKEWFDQWRNVQKQKNENESGLQTIAHMLGEVNLRIQVLMDEAVKGGKRDELLADFWAWSEGIIENYDLRDAERNLRRRTQDARQKWRDISPPGTNTYYGTVQGGPVFVRKEDDTLPMHIKLFTKPLASEPRSQTPPPRAESPKKPPRPKASPVRGKPKK